MRRILSLLAISIITYSSFAQSGSPSNGDLKLWYDKPAGKVWEAALPIGNGRIAAMVYGNPDSNGSLLPPREKSPIHFIRLMRPHSL